MQLVTIKEKLSNLQHLADNLSSFHNSFKKKSKVVAARIARHNRWHGPKPVTGYHEMRLHEVLSSSPWKTVSLSACQRVAHWHSHSTSYSVKLKFTDRLYSHWPLLNIKHVIPLWIINMCFSGGVVMIAFRD